MNQETLKQHLNDLISKYVNCLEHKEQMIRIVNTSGDIPVKGILADLIPYLEKRGTPEDLEIIKDIAYYYC